MSEKKKVLFVDDEKNILEGLRRSLSRMRKQWEMVFALSGEEALDILAEDQFDAIVSDMRMPEMNGAELLKNVKRLHPHMVRFILSGQSDEESTFEAAQCAHQYLSKPCDAVQLRESLGRSMDLLYLLPDVEMRGKMAGPGGIPSLPEVLDDLEAELQSGGDSTAPVLEIVSRDPGLSAKLIQLVSSSFFGFYSNVSSVEKAVSILGRDSIRKLSEVGVFKRLDREMVDMYDIETKIEKCRKRAEYSKLIAEDIGLDKDECGYIYIAGLLMDTGLAFLSQSYSDKVDRLAETMSMGPVERREAVTDLYGVSHMEVAACMLGLWGFPSKIVDTIRYHCNIDEGEIDERLAACVTAAEGIYRELDLGQGGWLESGCPGTKIELMRNNFERWRDMVAAGRKETIEV